MLEQKSFLITGKEEVAFHNRVDFCVGTGRMGLALQQEYQKQLQFVQKEIGFQHIRGHGLFSDDMAICQEYETGSGEKHTEYNFTYLDLVMDSYREAKLRPFLELGFMPSRLASGSQTIFYWKGNTTPPASYEAWCALVTATLSHLMERYGRDEVVQWPIEVWNEPNLPGFWENADMEEYFRLFRHTFFAVKALDSAFRVGGPAVCGVRDEFWIRSFLEFCAAEGIVPDFITRHHYTTDLPEHEGHYGYVNLSDPEEGFANLQTTRDIIDSFDRFRGLPIHLTEFNTSYIPNAPLHDTNQNAAYLALQLSRLGDMNESYSYWTFGDVFEEQGVPYTPFHGGFGLVANGVIPKPTFWTFRFFKELQGRGRCIHRSGELLVLEEKTGCYCGIAWNSARTRTGRTLLLSLTLPAAESGPYLLLTETVDEDTCNPLRLWHDMGEPASLSPRQLKLLREASRPFLSSRRIEAGEKVQCALELKEFAVVYFELYPVCQNSDRGYDYERAVGLR